jgi:alpha-tubulin suppressor-like RCC1 family protein
MLEKDEMGYVLTTPRQLPYKDIKRIALGEAHSMILDDRDCLRTFGWGEVGQLGVLASTAEQFKVHKVQ